MARHWLASLAIATYPSEGIPYKGGTSDFLQQQHQELFNALTQCVVSNFGITPYSTSAPYAITGNVFTPTTGGYNVSAGAIFYNGEIYLTPAGFVPTAISGQDYVGTITTNYFIDPTADPVTMSDGISTFNAHQILTIVWSTAPTGSGNFSYTNIIYMQNPIAALDSAFAILLADITTINSEISTINSEITVINSEITILNSEVALGSWFNLSGQAGGQWATGANQTRCRKDGMGRVYLQGQYITLSGSLSTVIDTLPSGYWPTEKLGFAIMAYNYTTSSFYTAYIYITTAGQIVYTPIGSLPSAANWFVDVSSISFLNS